MNTTLSILIIVPAFNEEEAIAATLTSLQKIQNEHRNIDILVVNDGSKDNTAQIVRAFRNVTLLNLPYNLGIGAAMQLGYKYAAKQNYDIALQFDADGQHNSDDIAHLLEPIALNKADFTIGSRFLEKNDYKGKLSRRIGIQFFSILLYSLTKKKFTDPTSGFRAANAKVIRFFAEHYPKDYPEPEVLIALQRKGMKLMEIPVNMKQRQGGASSITPIKSVYYMVKVTLAILMQRLSKV